jgi:CDP-2,3-bis-(O-geranylgeranyl)-sn-glycerol synthase
MHPLLDLQLLVLLAVANTAPLFGKRALGNRLAWPLDGGLTFFDGRPLFGASKTLRGLVLALLATATAGALAGPDWRIGALVAAGAMAGDLLSSFLKRRFGRKSSSRATGLDQIPESLLPLLACRAALPLTAADIALLVVLFFLGEVLFSRLFYRLGLRDRPY